MASSVILVGALLVGGALGWLVPEIAFPHEPVLFASAAVQLILSVGMLPRRLGRVPGDRRALHRLLVWHYLAGTALWLLPWVVLHLLMGVDNAALTGFTVLMAMPAAAGLPVYAAAARADARLVTRLAIRVYLVGTVLTPALLLVTVGLDDPLGLAWRLLVTLVAPSLLGMALRRYVQKIPRRLHFGLTLVAMAAACFVFGQSFQSEDLAAGAGWAVGIGAAAALVRLAVTVCLALWGTRRDPASRGSTVLAAISKNDALAATLALGLGGAAATVPGLVHMVLAMLVVVVLAASFGRAATRDRVEPRVAAALVGPRGTAPER